MSRMSTTKEETTKVTKTSDDNDEEEEEIKQRCYLPPDPSWQQCGGRWDEVMTTRE